MKLSRTGMFFGMILTGAALASAADQSLLQEIQAVRAQIQSNQSELTTLRAANGDTWLNERRAEEVKSLVKEVLSDADTRASLAAGGATAGHKNGHFFLASEDGNFLLQLSGQVQFRYIWQSRDSAGITNEAREGFQNRRTMIAFSGHLFDPKFTYKISLLHSDSSGPTELNNRNQVAIQNAWFAYEFADGWQVKAGQFKAPFLRDELVHSSKQLAVERAWLTDYFTVDYTQGVQISYKTDQFRVAAMVHDGTAAANTDYTSGGEAEVAIAARAEYLVAGSWSQFEDYQAWSKDKFALMIGAAIDYENGEGETGTTISAPGATPADQLRWTLDVTAKFPELAGLSLFGAVIGSHPQNREAFTASTQGNPDQIGFVVQAGVFVIPDKMDLFARWEYVDLDKNNFNSNFGIGAGNDDTLNALTFGANYYFHGHAAKATLDVVWWLDGGDPISTDNGAGYFGSHADNETSIRAQFQFLF